MHACRWLDQRIRSLAARIHILLIEADHLPPELWDFLSSSAVDLVM